MVQSVQLSTSGLAPGVSRLAEELDRLIAEVAAQRQGKPELMLDRDIRREYFGGMSRSTYWQITKQQGYPKAIEVSRRVKLRRRSEIEAWLAERQVS